MAVVYRVMKQISIVLRFGVILLALAPVSSAFGQNLTVGLMRNDPGAFDGYTLFAPSATAYLIDLDGRLVHSWPAAGMNPGASAYFLGGVVAYANSAKTGLLGVPAALLEAHGAVSEPVARAMAEGARARFGSDYAVATTGISGPDGGTDEKPVGLVSIGIAWDGGSHTDSFVFPLDRERHRQLSAQVCLDWVRRSLCGFELTGPSLLRQRGGGSTPGR